MITFNTKRLCAKGTCNVILSDPDNGTIYLQDNKMMTGSIKPSTNLSEIRAGLGNPIAVMIPTDSNVTVEFESAAFSLWAKAAQLGAKHGFGAPVPKCQIVTATSSTLKIDTEYGTPAPELGRKAARCYIQEVGTSSFIMANSTAYPIDENGVISEYFAEEGKTYKVWYRVQNASAEYAEIGSLIDPMVVRFEAQIAVFANKAGRMNQGTRVGWLYVTVPYLKLQGDGGIVGDQTSNDTTKISGVAIAYDDKVVTATCDECGTSALAYYVYAPDNESSEIAGIAVIGGVVKVDIDYTAQIPVRFVMRDGSLVIPSSYFAGFEYESEDESIATVSETGTVSGISQGNTAVLITYTDLDGSVYTCQVSIVSEYGATSSLVGYGQVGYMLVA